MGATSLDRPDCSGVTGESEGRSLSVVTPLGMVTSWVLESVCTGFDAA